MRTPSVRESVDSRVNTTVNYRRKRRNPGFGRHALMLGLLTASFDIFLAVDAGGFTLRAHQVLLMVALASALQLSYKKQPVRLPLGIAWLCIWVGFILAFIPNTVYVPRSLGYALWLMLDVCIVIVTVQLFGDRDWIETLLRGYLKVLLCLSCVGFLQLALGFARMPDPFVKQWVVGGVWPRLNGFSYEPSYYSTYLLLGWVFSAWLLEHRVLVFGPRLTRLSFAASTLALLLSTSRAGWAMMLLWATGYGARRLYRRQAVRISPVFATVLLLSLGIASTGIALFGSKHLQAAVKFLAGGTGIAGTPAHSVNDREEGLRRTIEIFEESPLIGYSLGGVATAIGTMEGVRVEGNDKAKQNEGGSVLAEVLAASGIVGFVPFLMYFYVLIRRPLKLLSDLDPKAKVVLSGLVWSLCMELLILEFNQNILRPYLWFHIGVLSAAYAALRHGRWRPSGPTTDIATT